MAVSSPFHFDMDFPIANDRVKLVPFDLDLHGAVYAAQIADHPELYANIPPKPPITVSELRALFANPDSVLCSSNPAHKILAIIDKTRDRSPEDPEGELAGMVGYIYASKVHLSSEIGPVIIFPAYQRTHVTSNAVGLVMKHGFAPADDGGMGLRRMQWFCSTANAASARAAERMGFKQVGVIPWHTRYPLGKRYGKLGNGKPLPPGSHPDDVWRDSFCYSLSWDVWEDEAREKVEQAMSG